jgi:hypothetical protein
MLFYSGRQICRRYSRRILVTGCFWLANVYEPKVRSEEFQLGMLTVRKSAAGVVTRDDGNGGLDYEQALNSNNFPEPEAKLYFCEQTILLLTQHWLELGKTTPVRSQTEIEPLDNRLLDDSINTISD